MKSKFKILWFILGFLSCIIIIVAIFFYVKNTQVDSLKKDLTNYKQNKIEIEIYSIDANVLDSLKFKNLKTGKIFCVNEDNIHYTFINYWATWCAPCIAELPEFENLLKSKSLETKDIKFVFSSSEKLDKIVNFINTKSFDLPFYQNNYDQTPSYINHTSIPTTYLIDENKLLIYKFSGMQKWNSKFISDILKNIIE
jgi:thiol-disulfide isomerase/thioredoxin